MSSQHSSSRSLNLTLYRSTNEIDRLTGMEAVIVVHLFKGPGRKSPAL